VCVHSKGIAVFYGERFVGNLVINTGYKFCYNDDTVTSAINITHGDVVIESVLKLTIIQVSK